jgi:hypothetical protein
MVLSRSPLPSPGGRRPHASFAPPPVCCSHASGTPLSVLDPPGSTTVEQVYKRIADNLSVRVAAVWLRRLRRCA